MKRFEWDSTLETGDKSIDDQHHTLFTLGKEFNIAIMNGGNPTISMKLIQDLANYAVTHFNSEEGWMRKAGYPELQGHAAMHEDLKRKLVNRIVAIKNGQLPMSADICIFLHDWITHHILEQDLRAIKWCKDHVENATSAA